VIIYFADRKMQILGHASTGLPNGIKINDDLKSEDVESGVATFTGYIQFDESNQVKLEEMLNTGNYILRKDDKENEFYTIIDSESDTDTKEIYFYAEDAGLDLLNEMAGAFAADESHDVEWYVNKYIADSGFEIGVNEISSDTTRKLSWDGESTVTERLASIATQFGGFEISYSFDIDGLQVLHKYVNIYRERGKAIGEQLRLNRDISRIRTKKSIAKLATAFSCTGGIPEGFETPITLKGYEYDDGDFYVGSDGILRSRKANEKWSRYIWKKEPNQMDGYDGSIVRPYSYETTSQKTLCSHAITELKKVCDLEVNYEVDIKRLPENIKVGDRVDIVNDAGELYLSARILKLEKSASKGEYTATLGEYLLKESGISQTVEELAQQFSELAKNRTLYTWIAYADDEHGNGISLDPVGKTYLGTVTNRLVEEVDITDPTIFSWSKIKGEDGTSGTGVLSLTEQYYLSSSSTAQVGGSWSDATVGWKSGYYIWVRNKIEWSDGKTTFTDPVLDKASNSANENAESAKQEAGVAADKAESAKNDAVEALAKVTSLEARAITTDTLTAKVAELGYLKANEAALTYATIENLNSANANISSLQSKVATIEKAYLTEAQIETLIADKGYITSLRVDELLADYAKITVLSAVDAKITSLTSKAITTDTLSAEVAKLEYLKADEAKITYATIANLNAVNATVSTLSAKAITTDNLSAKVAELGYLLAKDLEAEVAKFGYIKASEALLTYATISNLNAAVARIGTLETDTVKTERLEALVAEFGYLKANDAALTYATITNLNVVNGNIITIQSKIADIEKAYLNEAQINQLIVGKGYLTEAEVTTLIADGAYLNEAQVNTLIAEKGFITEAKVNTLLTDYATVKSLDAATGRITTLETTTLKTVNLSTEVAKLGYATADSLNAAIARIGTLESTTVKANELESKVATFGYLKTTTAEAYYATIANVKATYATIENVKATYATIESLKSTEGKIDDLTSIAITTDNLSAKVADLGYLTVSDAKATYATITNLNTANANISALQTKVANINTIMFGSASGSSLTTEFSNSVIALIGDATISSAKIASIVADKITSGALNTSSVTVKSSNGRLQITGDTILIKDANRTRVQLGKDANSDYNIYVADASGNVMFDATGIHSDAIKNPIIENAMVADDANISASKLDIDSLFTEINGSANTIKSTKVYLDDKKQTLDVAFSNVTTEISDINSDISSLDTKVTSQGTSISTIQGQISSKIWTQDITSSINSAVSDMEDITDALSSRLTTQENNYSTLNQTVSGLSSTVASHTTQIASKADGSTMTSLSSKVTTLESSLNGFKTIVADTYATKTEFSGKDPFIKGTQTAATGSWTGTAPFTALEDGQQITYWLPYAGSGNATLNLTLSNGTTTGAVACYYSGTTRLTTHYAAGNVIHLTYRKNVTIGSSTYTGWWADANYDTNYYDRLRYQKAIKASAAITAGNIIVGNASGYHHLKTGTSFDIGYPILYAGAAISSGSTGTNNYLIYSFTVTTTQSISLTAYKAVYIKGTLDGVTFTPASTAPLTQTVPTSEDGYFYMLLGTAVTSTTMYLLSEHPLFKYDGDGFKSVEQILMETQTIAEQTADQFTWLVKSGTSSTNFTLTDRMANLLSSQFNIDALTTFMNSAKNGTSTVINGGSILTGTITADKINVTDLFAQDITATGSITGLKYLSSGTDSGGYPSTLTMDAGDITLVATDGSLGNGTYKYNFESYISGHHATFSYNVTGAEYNFLTFNGNYLRLINYPNGVAGSETVVFEASSANNDPFVNCYNLTATGATTLKGALTFETGTTQSATKGIKWQAINSKNPYIGYATDQVDGTFVVGSLLGTNYASGLAIGGGSGNLLWKGAKVATATDLAGYALASHTHSYLPLSGGTITGASGDTPLYVKSASTGSYIGIQNSSGSTLGYFGFSAANTPVVYIGSAKKILHEGNWSSYCAAASHTHNYMASNPTSIELNSTGSLSGYGGFIDFHFNGSTEDYTSRIIENASGQLQINGVTITSAKVVTATTFIGSLSGNATSATKATNDGNGRQISRFYCSMIPAGTSIPANANLNTTDYLKVGNYYCSQNVNAATLTNSPLSVAFAMQVFNPLSTTVDNETTGTWVYRLRKITCYNTGVEYIQYCYAGATANSWTYGDWYVVPRSKFTLDTTDTNGGSAQVGSATQPVYVGSDGTINKCTYTLGKSVPSNAVFTDTTYAVATASANGLLSAADKDKLDVLPGKIINGGGTGGGEIFNDYTNNKAAGAYAHAEGYKATASASASHAEGYNNTASAGYAHVEGRDNTASGTAAHAEGYITTASATASHSEGYNTKASGDASHAEGYWTTALAWQHAQGHYNNTSTAAAGTSSGTGTGTAFVIGNGTASSPSNAFRVNYNGQPYALNALTTSGCDYAEYFEWLDGNLDEEDRRGYFVTLDGDKIRKAEPGDYILGITSALPSIIGNGDECWKGRYILDEFGDFIVEEIECEETVVDRETGEITVVKKVATKYKENPDYDPSQAYIQREDRPEWAKVGMLGVIAVRDDGTCQVNGFCKVAKGGIATASETGYRVIARTKEKIVKVIFKF